MAKKSSRKSTAVFISHAAANLEAAQRVEASSDAAGFDPWLDRSDIRVGALLGRELRQVIEASKAVVLMWSKAAASSPWVATEVLTAFHLNRYIVPRVLSGTELPQFLSRSVYFDFRKRRADVLARLGDQVARAARARNEFPAVASYQPANLQQTIRVLNDGQRAVLDRVDADDLAGARKLQTRLTPQMRAGEARWRFDPTILNLAGYHRKNAYMLKHWEAYCAGRFPPDALLAEGRTRFFATLFANPIDYTALNGLGNILLFAGELDAAEFFVESAVKCAGREGVAYPEATHDLQLIRSRTRSSRRGQRRLRRRGWRDV
jgi:hypothetical protein